MIHILVLVLLVAFLDAFEAAESIDDFLWILTPHIFEAFRVCEIKSNRVTHSDRLRRSIKLLRVVPLLLSWHLLL